MQKFGKNINFVYTYINSSTNLRQTPESMTAWIFSLGPSDKYDKAQQESASTSASLLKRSRAKIGKQGDTLKKIDNNWFNF